MFVHNTLFERNNSIIRDSYMLRTDLCAAFCDVAVADAEQVLQVLCPVFSIKRMHLKRRRVHQKSRSDKFVVFLMVAKHVANILTEKTLDAFAKFLHAI